MPEEKNQGTDLSEGKGPEPDSEERSRHVRASISDEQSEGENSGEDEPQGAFGSLKPGTSGGHEA